MILFMSCPVRGTILNSFGQLVEVMKLFMPAVPFASSKQKIIFKLFSVTEVG